MLMQSEIAGVGRRLVATALDLVVLHLALSIITRNMLLSPVGVWMVDFVIAVVYSTMFVGLKGQTLGKMALGLQVIDARGRGLDYVQTFRRAIVKWAPVFVLFVLMAVFMPEELQQRPAGGEMVETVEVDPQSAMASSAMMVIGTIGWLVLIHLARRHPDGQGVHDRVAETFVIKAG